MGEISRALRMTKGSLYYYFKNKEEILFFCHDYSLDILLEVLERVEDAAVVQLYADGFDDLALREKTLIYHLYQAAIAGRDIY